jgi:hypothetical protein
LGEGYPLVNLSQMQYAADIVNFNLGIQPIGD